MLRCPSTARTTTEQAGLWQAQLVGAVGIDQPAIRLLSEEHDDVREAKRKQAADAAD